MVGFNELLDVSFMELEKSLFGKLRDAFVRDMAVILEALDGILFAKRDASRYRVAEIAKTRIETMFGTVEFRRRVYEDQETGERVYGLDEALGLSKRARISPGLREMAVHQAVDGPSYRGARDMLKGVYGYQALSHESIRGCVIKAGEMIAAEAQRECEAANGRRKVGVLYIEADGMWVSVQREGKREAHLAVAYEGWRRRGGSRDEYELVGRTDIHAWGDADQFWEQVSRRLWAKYDLDDTVVVIGGDRALWIRKGTEYFPKAMYQFDRFHLKREMKKLLEDGSYAQAARALDEGRAGDVLEILRQARPRNRSAAQEARHLIADLERHAEAMVDYRLRLEAMGYDTTGMRGLGAAEPMVNRYSRRLKKQGRSWGGGLDAMIHAMQKRFSGELGRYTKKLYDAIERLEAVIKPDAVAARHKQVVREVLDGVTSRMGANMPILSAGRTRSGGLSWTFQRLLDATPATLY